MFWNFFIVFILSVFLSVNVLSMQNPDDVNKEDLKDEFEKIYNIRSSCLVAGDTALLKDLYDSSQKLGRYALEHEISRVKYLKYWSEERGIKFKNIE